MMDIEKVGMDELLPEQFRNVDILVNNAGLALGKNSVEENVTSDIVRMMTTNVTALIIATTLFTKGMKARGRGHVINVGSIAGHYAYGGGSGYCASKSAVTAFTSAARHDLVGTPIRVTCISPGFAETEFSLVRFEASDDAASKAKSVYDNLVPMVADDIADQIIYAATRPAHVQIQDIAWPTNQGRSYEHRARGAVARRALRSARVYYARARFSVFKNRSSVPRRAVATIGAPGVTRGGRRGAGGSAD